MHPHEAIQLGLLEPETTPYYQIGEFTTTKLSQSWVLRVTAGSSYYVDWGDGAVDWLAGNGSDQTITHTYATAGTYKPKWWIQDATKLLKFVCTGNALSGLLPSFAACTNLIHINCNNNIFTGPIPSFAGCSSLQLAYLNINQFSGSVPSFNTCTQLQQLYLQQNTELSGTLPSFSNTSLTLLYIGGQISGYAGGGIPLTCNTWYVAGSALTQTAVDTMLADIATNIASRPAGGTLDLSGGTNAIPSSAGLINKATIAARPWTVTTN